MIETKSPKSATSKPPSHQPAANLARATKWKKDNPEKYAESRKRLRLKNPEKHRGYMRAWRRKKLGEIPREPPTRCECCGCPLVDPNLDHCHKTGMFRGWLCGNCNRALGLAGDTVEGVRKLLAYIERAYADIDARLLK